MSTGVYLFENSAQIFSPETTLSVRLLDKGRDITLARSELYKRWLDVNGTLKIERDGSRLHWLVLEVVSFHERPLLIDGPPPPPPIQLSVPTRAGD